MIQDALFHETLNDALKGIVERTGGNKAVGSRLRPSKAPEQAGRWLADCLNPNREERLDPEDFLHLLRIGREVGYHGAMAYIGQETGYRCEPVEPMDEQAKLQRDYIEAVKALGKIGSRLEKLIPQTHMKMVGT